MSNIIFKNIPFDKQGDILEVRIKRDNQVLDGFEARIDNKKKMQELTLFLKAKGVKLNDEIDYNWYK
jgi:hypothetical protein